MAKGDWSGVEREKAKGGRWVCTYEGIWRMAQGDWSGVEREKAKGGRRADDGNVLTLPFLFPPASITSPMYHTPDTLIRTYRRMSVCTYVRIGRMAYREGRRGRGEKQKDNT